MLLSLFDMAIHSCGRRIDLFNILELSADVLVVVVVIDQDNLPDEGGRGAGEDGEHCPEERRSGLVPVCYDDRCGVGNVGDQRGPVL